MNKLPSAEVADILFRTSEKLDKYIEKHSVRNETLWRAVIEQLDTIASVISEEDDLCDNCAMQKAVRNGLCAACEIVEVEA